MDHGRSAVLLALAFLLAAGAAQATPRSAGRDLSSVDVCRLMPDKEVARILGNQPRQPGERRDFGATQQGCAYWLGMAEKGTFEYVHIHLASPDLFETLESALETEKGLGQKATGEVLAGLGDEAFAVHNKTTGDTTIHVLRRGDVWLEVKADTLDHARKLAEAVLQRLGPK